VAGVFLREGGHRPQWVSHGNEALQLLQWQRPDVVLAAQSMAGMPGSQLVREIRASERYADLPVLLMTMGDSQHQRLFAERAGANGIVRKPLLPDALLVAVREVLQDGWALARTGR
jgi:two-component system chemotaxis response regulator CheY